MDNRSTKYRSLEAKGGGPSTRSRERHNSVPTADRRKDQQSRQVPASATSSDNNQRSSKSRPRQDSATSPDQSTITRHLDRQPQSKLGSKTSNSNLIPFFNFLVLGSLNSGKSTFVKHAIDREGHRTSTQVTVKDSSYRVHFIELDLDDVDFSSERRLEWPTYLNGAPFPEPDGVFCLYSVSDKESVADIPTALTSGRANKIAQAATQPAGTQRITAREPSPKKSRSRSRSNGRLQTSKSKEFLLNLSTRPAVIESGDENEFSVVEDVASPPRKTRLRLDTTTASQSQPRRAGPHTPVSSGDYTNKLGSPPEPTTTAVPETPDSYYVKSILRPPSSEGADSRAYQSFLNMDDDHNENSARPEIEQLGPPLSSLKLEDNARQDAGVSFKELVEKLLVLPANKIGSKFVPSFLCLYRAFATPQKLLAAIIDQFVAIEKSNMVHFSKVAEMLRYLQVLAQWTATYPGDFAEGPARDLATAFVQNIEKSKVFAPAAREISNNLDTLVPDEDAEWAFNDAPSPRKTPTSSSANLQSLNNELPKKFHRVSRDEDDSEDDGDATNSSAQDSNAPSASSSIIKPYNSSSQSASNFAQLENAKVQADKLKLIPHIRLSKLQWHQFMEIPVEDLAKEITRVDWTMYSAIRPRDFVRHVFLSTEQRRRSRTVDNISAMVKHFNHLALFVSGMILLRDKPKHRARALEKFMALAWKVRQLNNYNSLGAIVAGITGHEIARLTATRDLVPADVQKQFLRLTILMGTSRSHAAYRMAWDNSFQERIPFLPLVRQDLTMAASANSTFIGSNVNWKKFEIMGEVIVGLQKSLETPYTFPPRSNRTEEITRLLLETKILEESEDSADPGSELYDRSVQLEPQNGVDQRKKFDWLRRS
ncbi:hypothetical protein LTR10_022140 [Elasticomyces elasticus]|nr:hypothetical protein LTR10_022140 [Elasticomyces elasticus]KAK5036876.1 hypothetical protein LTR13_005256 [Exophiala sideris]